MATTKTISSYLQKQLSSAGRDGVSVGEAAVWLSDAGLLSPETHPEERLRDLLREGKIKGAYQFPNKRWVIVNNAKLPDGVQRVVPVKEAARTLGLGEKTLRRFVAEGKLAALDFGPSPLAFLEEELKRFHREHVDRTYELGLPMRAGRKAADLDKLKRQLYYLRSDVRLIVERIEELIKLLD